MSAVHCSPSTLNAACDHAQRLKPCTIAATTPVLACAFAAIADKGSGASPDMTRRPSFQRASCQSRALKSVGAKPHNSSAAGHKPKRKITRAASAAACVPTYAPVEPLVAELTRGTKGGLHASASGSAWVVV